MYKYLLWDIDGTILDFKASEAYAFEKLFKVFGFKSFSKELLADYEVVNMKYWHALERGEMSKSEILYKRFEEFFALIGEDPSVAKQFDELYQVTLGEKISFIQDADKILLSLKDKYKLLAVTNGTLAAQSVKLKNSGLDKVFDGIYISDVVGYEKPDKRFFDFLIEKENITDISQLLIIGDSLTSDMQGGINSNIDTCWFNLKLKENINNLPIKYEIRNLNEIYKILK